MTPEQEARRLELEEELRWMAAERRRDTRLMLAGVVGSVVVALPIMMSSATVTDVEVGRALLSGGVLLGYTGVVGSIGWGLWRAVERGDTYW